MPSACPADGGAVPCHQAAERQCIADPTLRVAAPERQQLRDAISQALTVPDGALSTPPAVPSQLPEGPGLNALLSLFYRQENRSRERLSDLPKVTRLVHSGARTLHSQCPVMETPQ